MDERYRQVARRRLDAALAGVVGAVPPRPPDGWIRTIRLALGMTLDDLAVRLGVTRATVARYERTEQAGTIKLATLERVLGAFGLGFTYVPVPTMTLDAIVQRQARTRAAAEVEAAMHTMSLEDQRPDPAGDAERVDRRALELVDSPRLWKRDRDG